jgi:nucleoside 2-deoxyribosyltransferase
MPVVKYQIFISSTFEDLVPKRDQVIKSVLEMGHIPVGMEMFSAAEEQQWEIIKRQIDQSDYYVVLVAHRYGSMDGDISFTEKEYDYAVSKKIPALGFVLDAAVDWSEKWIENNNDIKKRLDNFKSKVSGRMVSFWKSADDLYGKCGIALMKAFAAYPRLCFELPVI